MWGFDHRGPLVVWPFGAKLLEWIFSQKRDTLGHKISDRRMFLFDENQ